MALFDFQCPNCKEIKKNVFLPLDHDEDDHPECCRMLMRKFWTKMPLAYDRDYTLEEPFRAAHDGTVITTRKENREYMKRHSLLDANEVYEKPTFESEARERAESQAAIDAITPTHEEMAMLRDANVVDSDGQLITD
jgi:hypothetical protein